MAHGAPTEAECMIASAARYKSQRQSAFRCFFIIEVLPHFATAMSQSRSGES
jgi:hypothetical protein